MATRASNTLEFLPGKLPGNEYAFKNNLYLHPQDYQFFLQSNGGRTPVYVKARNLILRLEQLDGINVGEIGASAMQKEAMRISKIDTIRIEPIRVSNSNLLSTVECSIDVIFINNDLPREPGKPIALDQNEVSGPIVALFQQKYLNKNEIFPLALKGGKIVIKVAVNSHEALKNSSDLHGVIDENTIFRFKVGQKSQSSLKINSNEAKQLFKDNISFNELGIGGLDEQFAKIFRRAFNSRRYPQNIIEKYGVKHCKGMLLYGPPGTGKTLIARQIAKALNCNEPQVVNGPQIFDKFVGGSEKKIRDLFAPAEAEQNEKGDDSDLHIIIFDEIDAICRQRGSGGNSGTNVHESVVNQLLSKLDGVDSLNNILVIGMTNRIDMIDEAMLRPGRLELHLEIGLPDEGGRLQIFNIHTRKMKKNGLLGNDVDLNELARITKNYTGAEIEAVCGSARSFALFGHEERKDLAEQIQKQQAQNRFVEREVTMQDFLLSLEEIKPAFGVDDKSLENSFRGGIYNHGVDFQRVFELCNDFVTSIRNSSSANPLLSLLLEGDNGSGKTALAAKIAIDSGFPFVKMISPEQFVGYTDFAKVQAIAKVFEDAYKSPLSLIVLDDIERLLEFVHIGPRFSNTVLQALLVLIKKKPPNAERKLLVLGTTSMKDILSELEVISCFNTVVRVPSVHSNEELTTILSNFNCAASEVTGISSDFEVQYSRRGVPIKQLLLAVELAIERDGGNALTHEHFMDCLSSVTGTQI